MKKKNKKGGTSTMVAGATGAVVGAALGTAAAIALSSEKTRKKIEQKVNSLTEYASDAIDAVSEETANKTRKLKKAVIN